MRLHERDALVLDFDGTLAPIGPDPDAVMLPHGAAEALHGLSRRLGGAVAVLSGRDLRDLARRVPAGLWRAGGHGTEILPPHAPPPPAPPPPPEALLAPLREAARHEGVWIEIKGPVVALHYRAAPEAGPACLEAAGRAAAALPGHKAQPGKMVVEVKPLAADKGLALRSLMDRSAFAGRRPVMVGDDATDEDAMEAALALGGVAVKVGEGPSVAAWRAADPAAVLAWLGREAAAPLQGKAP
ncbi:trehalose-phosphatase [Rubellimicrobium sp. CFH 75288]|nr:trehalose-phosphatase [Rubellimicrobium sp. CFH 75288]